MSDFAKMVSRHILDDDQLGKYLLQQLPKLKLPVVSTKIGYGQSNPTYFVDDANGFRCILRKRPSGIIISPVAHQVHREYQVLKALGTVEGFPVPKVYCLCEDESVVGTAFYVMEFLKGRIITDPELKELPPSQRRPAWLSVISTLAWLHSIDPDSIGLSSFGKKTSFYARHCNTFSRIEAQQAKVKDISTGEELGRAHPNFDEIVDYVRKNVPTDKTSIIHGDYKFDNIMLHPTEPRVVAILDWELSTIGHPLMDVVFLVAPYWNHAGQVWVDDEASKAQDDQGGYVYNGKNLAKSSLPVLDELLNQYSRIVGWDPRVDRWDMAMVFHLMRSAVITHGIQARSISGQASSEFSHQYFENTRRSLDTALRMIREIKEHGRAKSSL